VEIAAGEFKAKCLKLMDQVEKTREPVIVTKRGKPIAQLVPVDVIPEPSYFGYMQGTVTILGDIVAPSDLEWHAESGRDAHVYVPSK